MPACYASGSTVIVDLPHPGVYRHCGTHALGHSGRGSPLNISKNPLDLLHGFLLLYHDTLVLLAGVPYQFRAIESTIMATLHVGAQLVGRIVCVLQSEGSLFVAAKR
jgi:hypothetical protein